MLKNSIVYDNNIVNICFKVKAKKVNGQMREAPRKSQIEGGDQSHGGGGLKILGMGGDRSPWGGDNPLMGVGPPPSPPILGNPA